MAYYTDKLKEIRDYHGFSQKEIAEVLKISQQHYSMYETGKRILNAEQIILLCKHYNVSADYLLGFDDTIKPLNKDK